MMDNNQKVEIQCEQCGNVFEILAIAYEKLIETTESILCIDCLDKIEMPRQQFEYLVIEAVDMQNSHGQDGWELVSVDNGKMYFKRNREEQ